MTRVKRGTAHVKRRRNLLKRTKGFKLGRRKNVKLARQATIKAGQNAYAGRKRKKADFRKVWIVRMNAALKAQGVSYSKFTGELKKQKIELNRKVLAEMAANNKSMFDALVAEVQKNTKDAKPAAKPKKAAAAAK